MNICIKNIQKFEDRYVKVKFLHYSCLINGLSHFSYLSNVSINSKWRIVLNTILQLQHLQQILLVIIVHS